MAVQKTEKQLLVINRVKKLRVDNNVSQQQLALILGATNGHIGNIESLKYANKYTLNQLNQIAHHFKIPIESFFMTEIEKVISLEEYTNRVCEYLEGE
ncbi:MAG: helix-turn-helix domain-containing protein [Bacteroidaceae bacterium]|nr:helix-turn-helix domain-containing protein [Bacteroidaceae bacterium]